MRIPYLTPESLEGPQRALYESILGGKRAQGSRRMHLLTAEKGLIGPFNAWLRSPEVGDRLQRLGEGLRFDSSLPDHVLEIAILVTARKWRARFEWWAHARLARRAGVADEVIEAIRTGKKPEWTDPMQRSVFAFSHQLLEHHQVSDEIYLEAKQLLGEGGVVDLVSLLGYYGLVSMTLNVFRVPLPEGEEDPFAGLE